MTDTMHGTQGGAADAARSVGTTAKERGTDVASSASEEAKAVAHDAKDQAREVINRSREQLRTQASEQGDRLASTLRDVGDQLRAMSRGEAQPDSRVVSLTSQLADTVSGAASRIGDGGYQGAIDDVKRFARNRPGMFLLGALGAGFVVGRMVKSVDTGSLLQAAKPDDSASQFAAGSEALSASSSFDPQLGVSEPMSSLPPPTTSPTTTPSTAMPGAVPPEVP